jgi:uncharacterized protein
LAFAILVKVQDIQAKKVLTGDRIQELSQQIAAQFSPERIILFGSHAYGKPTVDSDVDLLVVMPFEGQAFRKAAEILNQISPTFSVDLLVRTAEQLDEPLELGDFFLREIVTRGKVLYEYGRPTSSKSIAYVMTIPYASPKAGFHPIDRQIHAPPPH